MKGFASGGSIRSSDIPVAGGGRALRGQECPRSLLLRFGGSMKGFASGGSMRTRHLSVGLGGFGRFTAAFSMKSITMSATGFPEDFSMPSSPGEEFTSITTGP